MKNKYLIKNLWLGFLSWLVPFTVSCLFFRPGGELAIPHELFKSIMIVVGTASGCFLLFRYFRSVDHDFVIHGLIVGLSWFMINILLDTIILIPMMKVNFENYFTSIGLSYLVIPIIGTAMGYLLHRREIQ